MCFEMTLTVSTIRHVKLFYKYFLRIEATQQLDDIIWDVEELQRIAWKVGARLGTFYKDEGSRHVIINVVINRAHLGIKSKSWAELKQSLFCSLMTL